MHKKVKKKLEGLHWKVRKYSRWFKLYFRRVQMIEKEMGGEIESC